MTHRPPDGPSQPGSAPPHISTDQPAPEGAEGEAEMRHCKGCSHPTICNTHGCGAEEARANKAKAELKAQLGASKFTGVAERKLTGLIVEDGFAINGVAIRNDKTGQQGFVTNGGVVGWWRPENDAQMIKAKCDELAKDAARYRWLAAYARSTSEHWGGRWSLVIDGPAPKSHDSEDDLDAAVDAAIAKAEGTQEKQG